MSPFSSLPRNMNLKAFDPHRKSFECKHEADVLPAIKPEAEALFQRGMALTSLSTPRAQRNAPEAARLWQQAADMGHWKALVNLASLYINGYTEPLDSHAKVQLLDRERGVKLVEQGMKAGVPAAFDLMGSLHAEGLGVKGDASRAWAFWELAADMGNARAQGYIGSRLKGGYNNPGSLMWANKPVAVKMMECAIAQSDGATAYEFGTWLSNIGIDGKPDHTRALRILHDGVKWGNDKCADELSVDFSAGTPLVSGIPDEARGRRYSVLGTAMRYSGGDLRLPNLDKVLPLPPAQLPKWDGDEDTLIDAAKAVVPVAPPKPSVGSQRSGRAHVPQGYVLPQDPVPPSTEAMGLNPTIGVPPQYESTTARFSGYWLPQLAEKRTAQHTGWNRAQVPQRYARGEPFEPLRAGLSPRDGRILWHYLGVAQAVPAPEPHPALYMRVARQVRPPEPGLDCAAGTACPRTGIWMVRLPKEHSQAVAFNHWSAQGYFEKGQTLSIQATEALKDKKGLRWHWLDNANDIGFAGFADLTLTDLHDAEGNPLA